MKHHKAYKLISDSSSAMLNLKLSLLYTFTLVCHPSCFFSFFLVLTLSLIRSIGSVGCLATSKPPPVLCELRGSCFTATHWQHLAMRLTRPSKHSLFCRFSMTPLILSFVRLKCEQIYGVLVSSGKRWWLPIPWCSDFSMTHALLSTRVVAFLQVSTTSTFPILSWKWYGPWVGVPGDPVSYDILFGGVWSAVWWDVSRRLWVGWEVSELKARTCVCVHVRCLHAPVKSWKCHANVTCHWSWLRWGIGLAIGSKIGALLSGSFSGFSLSTCTYQI